MPLHQVVRLVELPAALEPLVIESAGEGFRFLARLVDEWHSGANRFALPGEALFAVTAGEELFGVGGLNRDPYAHDDGVGRVRHFYVRAAVRRQRVGTTLLMEITKLANGTFRELRLRTDSADAALFYEQFGFSPASCPSTHTHKLDLLR